MPLLIPVAAWSILLAIVVPPLVRPWLGTNDSAGPLTALALETVTRQAPDESPARNGGIYKSLDRGEHWFACNVGLPDARVHALAVDPVIPQTLYVVTEAGVFKSVDRAQSWVALAFDFGKTPISDLVLVSAAPPTLYVTTAAPEPPIK